MPIGRNAARPVIAIIGRPNVGKSTLFNRLAGGGRAIVIDAPGATRDRNYADCTWNDRPFTLIDTGGFLWELSPTVNLLSATACGVLGTVYFALRGRDLKR